jgi:hypothetical protein
MPLRLHRLAIKYFISNKRARNSPRDKHHLRGVPLHPHFRIQPPELLGRANAAMQLASRGMLPIGALAGGFLGEKIGIANTLWIGAAGVLLSTLFLVPVLLAQPEREGNGGEQ